MTGQFNTDECEDLVVGAPMEDWNGAANAGNAYAIYGSNSGLTTTGDWSIVQGVVAGSAGADDRFATRLWTLDRNEDGYDDLVVMVPGDPCGGPTQKGFHFLNGGANGLGTYNQDWFCFEHLNN